MRRILFSLFATALFFGSVQAKEPNRKAKVRVYFSDGGYGILEPRSKWPGDAYILKTEKAALSLILYGKAKDICIEGLSLS